MRREDLIAFFREHQQIQHHLSAFEQLKPAIDTIIHLTRLSSEQLIRLHDIIEQLAPSEAFPGIEILLYRCYYNDQQDILKDVFLQYDETQLLYTLQLPVLPTDLDLDSPKEDAFLATVDRLHVNTDFLPDIDFDVDATQIPSLATEPEIQPAESPQVVSAITPFFDEPLSLSSEKRRKAPDAAQKEIYRKKAVEHRKKLKNAHEESKERLAELEAVNKEIGNEIFKLKIEKQQLIQQLRIQGSFFSQALGKTSPEIDCFASSDDCFTA